MKKQRTGDVFSSRENIQNTVCRTWPQNEPWKNTKTSVEAQTERKEIFGWTM
jgi:hypothetical protein